MPIHHVTLHLSPSFEHPCLGLPSAFRACSTWICFVGESRHTLSSLIRQGLEEKDNTVALCNSPFLFQICIENIRELGSHEVQCNVKERQNR